MTFIEIALSVVMVLSLFQTILLLLITLSMVGIFFHFIRDSLPVDGVEVPSREDLPTSKPREFGW